MRIPLVASGPEFTARGREGGPAQLYDLMPTILDLFDLPKPYPLAGTSLMPFLRKETPPRQRRDLQQRTLIASNYVYTKDQFVEFAVIEAGRWKLMRVHGAHPARPFSLYELYADYHERNDVIDQNQPIARRLIGQLLDWRRQQVPFAARQDAGRLLLDQQQLEELRNLGYIR
jgi:arylsulfatase A-like enzyme